MNSGWSAIIIKFLEGAVEFYGKSLLIFGFRGDKSLYVQVEMFSQHLFFMEDDQRTDEKPGKGCN